MRFEAFNAAVKPRNKFVRLRIPLFYFFKNALLKIICFFKIIVSISKVLYLNFHCKIDIFSLTFSFVMVK